MTSLKQHYIPLRVLLVAGSAAQAAVLAGALERLRPAGELTVCAQLKRAVTEYQRAPFDVVLVTGSPRAARQVIDAVFATARTRGQFIYGGYLPPGRTNVAWCEEAGQLDAPVSWTPAIDGALALKLRSIQTFRQLWVGYSETTRMQLAMLEHIRDGVFLLDAADRVLHANREAERLFDAPPDGLIGRSAPELLANPDPRFRMMSAVPPMHVPGRSDWRLLMFRRGMTAAAEDNSPALLQDILTGLPTHMLMHDRLTKAVHLAARYSRNLGVMRLAVDEQVLAQVNETYGHTTGDWVLRELAERLSGVVRTVDTISRTEGGSFVAILQELSQPDDGWIVAQRMQAVCRLPYLLEDNVQIEIPVYLGMAYFPEHGKSAVELLGRSAIGLARAKLHPDGDRIGVFEVAVAASADRDLWERRLLAVLDNDELLLYFQPKISSATNQVVGVEALLRWRDGEAVRTPEKLIPIAEELGLIGRITEWVIREAARQAALWHRDGLDIPIAVNVPPSEFSDALQHLISAVLAEFNLPAHLLEVELTEAAMGAQQHADSYRVMTALSKMGTPLALDDFGTGYSSLDRLKTFPLQTLKIDKVFVLALQGAHLDADGAVVCAVDAGKDVAILRAIVALARNLGLNTVAEGVEDAAQAAVLKALGIDVWQGFYASRALPPATFIQWMAAWHSTQAVALY